MKIITIKNWGLNINWNSDSPLLISGPCSAESEQQVLDTCNQIKAHGVHILRAGIWKPRTRPNSFEGVGKVALPWLKKAGLETGLPICVEVANALHVEAALAAGVDILWIGARTTANPFAVQDIADALQGVDIPVMVKNPVNPDLELWIGALERIYQAGIHQLAAIHRGFSVYNSEKYRNQPQWEIPIELKRRWQGLEIICDPSHIAGKRDLLYEVAQSALDLNFEGLMIESHIQPHKAWSDAAQQVTPEGLQKLMSSLQHRKASTSNPAFGQQIEAYRKIIDLLDTQTLQALAERMEVVRKIGQIKKENNVAVLQLHRWLNVREIQLQKAKDFNLSDSFVEDLIKTIHKESLYQQSQIMQKDNISK